jgi:hypothetical protein
MFRIKTLMDLQFCPGKRSMLWPWLLSGEIMPKRSYSQ